MDRIRREQKMDTEWSEMAMSEQDDEREETRSGSHGRKNSRRVRKSTTAEFKKRFSTKYALTDSEWQSRQLLRGFPRHLHLRYAHAKRILNMAERSCNNRNEVRRRPKVRLDVFKWGEFRGHKASSYLHTGPSIKSDALCLWTVVLWIGNKGESRVWGSRIQGRACASSSYGPRNRRLDFGIVAYTLRHFEE